jgi:predicted ribosomally synthesized peptide with SipW-like signal peptide
MRHQLTSPIAKKLLATASLLGAAAAVAGLGSFAAFTDSTSATHSVDSGTVTASLGAAGGTDNRLTIGANAVAAGDMIQRAVKLSNNGTLDWAAASLTTTAPTSSLLDTDATDGLQMSIDKCSVAWTEAGTAPAYTYTCGGTQTALIASRPVIGTNLDLGSLGALAAGGSDYLRVTLELPATADNSFQGLSSAIDFAFTGTQRTATNR